MKHALIVTNVGGFLSKFEMNSVKILQQKGYTVHYATNFDDLLYDYDENKYNENDITLHQIEIRKNPFSMNNLVAVFQLARVIRKNDISLIHCHTSIGGAVARAAAKISFRKPRMIYTTHGFYFYKGAPRKNFLIFGTMEKILARGTDAIITINREDYDYASKMHLRNNGHVYQIKGVGVDENRFREMPELKTKVRDELNIPQNAFHIVSVGELNNNKNHRAVIEAISRLNDENVYYSICGEGEEKEKLLKLIDSLGLEDRVKLLGYRNDVEIILQSADCFVFPSIREGFGMAAVEALSCGVPVICADNRGTREYMKNGINGLVFEKNCVSNYKKAISKLIKKPELLNKMRKNTRESILDLTLSNTYNQIEQIYEENVGK